MTLSVKTKFCRWMTYRRLKNHNGDGCWSRLLDGLMSELRHRWGLWLWSKPNTQKNGRGICLNSFLLSTDVIQNMNSSIVRKDCKKFQTTTNNCPPAEEAEAEEFNECFFVVYESERKHMYFQFRKEVHCHELCFLFEKLPGSFIGTIRWKSSLNVSLFEKKKTKNRNTLLNCRWNADVTQNLVVVAITNRLCMNWVFGLYFKKYGFLISLFLLFKTIRGLFYKIVYISSWTCLSSMHLHSIFLLSSKFE